MIVDGFEKSNKNQSFENGEVICIDENGLAKKIENENDLCRILGIVSYENLEELLDLTMEEIQNGIKIPVATVGKVFANTNEKDIVAGDLLVAELDSTVRVRNANDEDIDIIGMALRKPENGKVLIKIK